MSFIIYWCILRYKISIACGFKVWVALPEGLSFGWNRQKVSIFDDTNKMSLLLMKQSEGLYFLWNKQNVSVFGETGRSLLLKQGKQSLLLMKQAKVSTFCETAESLYFNETARKPESARKSLLLLKQTKSLYFCTTVLFPTDSSVLGEHWPSLSRTGRVYGRSGPCITECWPHQRLLTWRIAFTDIDS